MKAIDRADVALLVLDATELVAAQDAHVAGYIQQATKGVLIIVNKWDLIPQKNKEEYTNFVRSQLKFLSYAPILYISAKSGQGVGQIMPQAVKVYQERMKSIPADELRGVVKSAVGSHVLPRAGRRELKFSNVIQDGTNPPSFEILVNDAKLIHFSYQRYMENKLRESFGFDGTPIKVVFKSRGEP
jgi:GTP-binding protein